MYYVDDLTSSYVLYTDRPSVGVTGYVVCTARPCVEGYFPKNASLNAARFPERVSEFCLSRCWPVLQRPLIHYNGLSL